MSAIVQRKLEFPIRKSTRLRSSKDADSQENSVKPESPRKRTKEGIYTIVGCNLTKKDDDSWILEGLKISHDHCYYATRL